MFEDFLAMIKNVEEAYKPFSIMKEGSIKDKITNFCVWILYSLSSIYLFYYNVINNESIHTNISWFCFAISFFFLFFFVFHIRNRESFIYSRKAPSEIKRLENFIVNLEKRNITSCFFETIISYYQNQLDKYSREKTNEIGLYITYFSFPVVINILCSNKDLHILILLIVNLGVFLIPGIIFTISLIVNKKRIMYSNIIYYLRLYLANEKYAKME